MSGWDLRQGSLKEYCVSEDEYWALFNYVFSDRSRKRNTYKFGLIKSIIDNLFNVSQIGNGIFFPYEQLFEKFTENYWNLVIKYDLRQMRKDGKSEFSKIETILKSAVSKNLILPELEYESIDLETKNQLTRKITMECKKYVIGALYDDFEGKLYSFDLNADGLYLSPLGYDFMLKYKSEIENLNYYAWAKFLEKINDDYALIRVIDKLELSTPKRSNLSMYRDLLFREFEECNCFYCGKKLGGNIHVDHFIPWSFVKDDKLWNFVLACPSCNIKKNNRLPSKELLAKIQNRNQIMKDSEILLVKNDFIRYTPDLLNRMWKYAKLSGLKVYNNRII